MFGEPIFLHLRSGFDLNLPRVSFYMLSNTLL